MRGCAWSRSHRETATPTRATSNGAGAARPAGSPHAAEYVIALASMSVPELSIVIPAYNEQARIAVTLARTVAHVRTRYEDAELIVVDDGSTDDTPIIVDQVFGGTGVKLLRQPRNFGKGAAVRRGMLAARGAYRLFMDADLSTPIEELETLMTYARGGCDVVIGSRGLADSDIRIRQPRLREWMGRTFNRAIVKGAFKHIGHDFEDTQCGFKLFASRAAEKLFSAQTLDGFAFDVEVLLLALEGGFRVKEIPVEWSHAPNSKVSPVYDAPKMLGDVVKLRMARWTSAPGRAPMTLSRGDATR